MLIPVWNKVEQAEVLRTPLGDIFYWRKITIESDFIDCALTNFPLLVYIESDADLASHAQPDGDDIYFTDSTNNTVFNHEIESYDGGTGQLIAWVNVTNIASGTDTIIAMHYGDTTCDSKQNMRDTWDTDYCTVQHFQEARSTERCG